MTLHNHDKFVGISLPLIFFICTLFGVLDKNMWFAIVCFALAVLSLWVFAYEAWRHKDDVG